MTSKKIWIALFVAIFSLGTWQTTGTTQGASKVSNLVNVYSCTQVGSDIQITLKKNWPAMTLKAGCSDAGHGPREYAFSCISGKNYKVEWQTCSSLSEVASLSVVNPATGATLGTANSGYLMLGGKYAAKQLVVVPESVASVQFNLQTKNATSTSNFTYAFAWSDTTNGSSINFNQTLAQSLAGKANFSVNSSQNLLLTDYYRGRNITAVAFVRNNDGISKVPNMPVEVDDVIAIHLRVLPMIVCDNQNAGTGFYNLCLGKTLNHSSGASVTYTTRYQNAIGVTVNGSAQKLIVHNGKVLSFLSPDQKTLVNFHVRNTTNATSSARVYISSQAALVPLQ